MSDPRGLLLVGGRTSVRGQLNLLGPQSRSEDKPFKFQVVSPQNGTAVLNVPTVSECKTPPPGLYLGIVEGAMHDTSRREKNTLKFRTWKKTGQAMIL